MKQSSYSSQVFLPLLKTDSAKLRQPSIVKMVRLAAPSFSWARDVLQPPYHVQDELAEAVAPS